MAESPDSSTGPRYPDGAKPQQIAVLGKKGQGKTVVAMMLFNSYRRDRALVDPNGDIHVDGEVEELTAPVPGRWPADPRGAVTGKHRRRTLRFVPDFHSATYVDDIDRVVGLAYAHGDTCLLVDEAHEGFPAGKVPPNARRALRQGRHNNLTLILATPRPITVDPLVIANADWVYIFKIPNPADRKRVAETIGWDPKDFDEGVHELGDHEYLRFDAQADELLHYPPLPARFIAQPAAS